MIQQVVKPTEWDKSNNGQKGAPNWIHSRLSKIRVMKELHSEVQGIEPETRPQLIDFATNPELEH